MPIVSLSVNVRLLLLGALLFIEFLLFSLTFDAYSEALAESGRWFAFLAYSGRFAKMLVAVCAIFLLAIWDRRRAFWQFLLSKQQGHKYWIFLCLQVFWYFPFLIVSSMIFGGYFEVEDIPEVAVVGWFLLLALMVFFWALSFAPLGYWREVLVLEKRPIGVCFVVGLLAWVLAQYAQTLWGPLGDLTFRSSAFLLEIFYRDVFIDSSSNYLGVNDFIVHISRQCSGYEGIGLVVIFTSFYLFMFKDELRFPQTLLLFPIGIVAIWCFNVIRIVLLIYIGDSFSEAIAIGGFHSQAGWIAFLIVIFGLLIIAHRLPFFSRRPASPDATLKPAGLSLPVALLIPFIVLMASVILTSAFTADIVWLYPLRVIAVAAALAFCWKTYSLKRYSFRVEPVLAGILVFIVWMLAVPNDFQQNQTYSQIFAETGSAQVAFWILFRFLGTVITVPLVEELLFRGYLLARLTQQPVQLEGEINYSWKGIILTSLLFGLLHSNFLAGVFAGVIYGVVRYRGASILDAVVAHAVTNFLLSVVVLAMGWWSIW